MIITVFKRARYSAIPSFPNSWSITDILQEVSFTAMNISQPKTQNGSPSLLDYSRLCIRYTAFERVISEKYYKLGKFILSLLICIQQTMC
jgi:hypothetical protein